MFDYKVAIPMMVNIFTLIFLTHHQSKNTSVQHKFKLFSWLRMLTRNLFREALLGGKIFTGTKSVLGDFQPQSHAHPCVKEAA